MAVRQVIRPLAFNHRPEIRKPDKREVCRARSSALAAARPSPESATSFFKKNAAKT